MKFILKKATIYGYSDNDNAVDWLEHDLSPSTKQVYYNGSYSDDDFSWMWG